MNALKNTARSWTLSLSCMSLISCSTTSGGFTPGRDSGGMDSSIPDASNTDSQPLQADLVRQMLADVERLVILPQYRDAKAKVEALTTALEALVASPSDGVAMQAAQDAYALALESWQRAELYQAGPAGDSAYFLGGKDLRDAIYAWPLVSACRIDQETVAQSYTTTASLETKAVNVRGLGAIDYLLFQTSTGNSCAPNQAINSNGSWTALGDTEVRSRRLNYALQASRLVVQHFDRLLTEWETFGPQFRTAGAGSTLFSSSQVALNALTDALFYLSRDTKDIKVGAIVGITKCLQDFCPEQLESPNSGLTRANVLANVGSIEAILTGKEGLGLEDLLRAVGASDLASRMNAAIAAAKSSIALMPETLNASNLEASKPQIVAAHDAIKAITDLMRAEMVTVLDLDLPQGYEGDND